MRLRFLIEPLESRIAPAFAAVFELASLNGLNGFKISGAAAGDASGYSVSAAGDVNGDTIDDIIVGAAGTDSNGSDSGASYVVFGRVTPFASDVNLAALDGSNGFKLSGTAAGDAFGGSVSAGGDVNGDGFDDLVVGAPGADLGGDASGASYVVFGKASGFAASLNVSALDGISGFKIAGIARNDAFGTSVSTAGDVNGDGFADILIGAPGSNFSGTNSGAGYVVFGKNGGFAPALDLVTLNGTNGFALGGAAAADRAGASVSAAGDVNGDGLDDLIIGAYGADANGADSGASYVVFGKRTGFTPNLTLSTLDGSNGFSIGGAAAGDRFGAAVSAAGDINKDGFDDIIIGAFLADSNGTDSGAAYVVFGKENGFAASLNIASLDGSNGFSVKGVTVGDTAGGSVSSAGDVNGDGFDDLIIGAEGADPNAYNSGASYVVHGKGGGFAPAVELSALDGSNGFTLNGVAPTDNSGFAVRSAGDFNGDGVGDFMIGAPGADSNGLASGTSYLVFGRSAELSITDSVADEGNLGPTSTSLQFTVALSAARPLPVSVDVSTVNGSAQAGTDFTPLAPMTITFAPGETSKTVTVDVIRDGQFEADETFVVSLSNAFGAFINDSSATGTIRNDDPPPGVTISSPSIAEGDAGTTDLLFTINLLQPSPLPVAVSFATSDGTALAGTDYNALAPGTIHFAPGETAKTIPVSVLGDTALESDETFSIVLSGATNATVLVGVGVGTILNDETTVRIDDTSGLEGHSGTRPLLFTVSLGSPSARPVSIHFASNAATATSGVDFLEVAPGVVTFAPGETTRTIAVDVLGDTIVESTETVSLIISDAINATIENGAATGTILDDDVTLHGKHKASFTDVDGESVTIKVSKGTLKVEDFTIVPSGNGAQLALVDFSGEKQFASSNLSVKSKSTPGGDAVVNVGHINVAGIDFGKVTVTGDLGRIDAGDALSPTRGLANLSAKSLGGMGLGTQLPGGSLQSEISGALKTLKLASGIKDAAVLVNGDVGSVAITGNVLGGSIRADGKIKSVTISGDLAANAAISARGTLAPGSDAKAVAIGTLSVTGSVNDAEILAGYDRLGAAVNADAAIGKVSVRGAWIASNIAAGVAAGLDALFGTDDDVLIAPQNGISAKIASIVIGGNVGGTDGGSDHFGFVAEEIAIWNAAGVPLPLAAGPRNDLAGFSAGSTGDLKVREVV